MSQTCGCGCRDGAAAAGVPPPTTTPDETVEVAARRSPRALAALRELGIDTCCGGSLTLAQAAAAAGVPTERVLQAVAGRAGT
jgi:iron-sulfur cluster repair protein YtfE (RIC family)